MRLKAARYWHWSAMNSATLRAKFQPIFGTEQSARGAGFAASPMVITGITSGASKGD